MGTVTGDIATFLIDTLFSLYIIAVMLRVLLGLVRADFYNPFAQFIVTLTNPTVRPLRRIVPSLGRVDAAPLVLLLMLKLLELWLLTLINGFDFNLPIMIWVALVQLVELLIYIYIFALIAQAILSWVTVASGGYPSSAFSILYRLTDPLLRPVRRIVPTIGMVDLSPLIVIIGLYVVLIVLRSLY